MLVHVKANLFQAIAVECESIRVSRHGIAKRAGGRVVARETFDHDFTPYYMAEEQMREWYPDCRIVIVQEWAR